MISSGISIDHKPGKRAQNRAKNWIQYSILYHMGQQTKVVRRVNIIIGMSPENCIYGRFYKPICESILAMGRAELEMLTHS